MRNCSNYRPLAIDSNDMARRMLGGSTRSRGYQRSLIAAIMSFCAVITMASVKSISAIRDAADH